MRLDQFKFKDSLELGVEKIAKVNTDSVTTVIIKKTATSLQLIKMVNNSSTYVVSFLRTEEGKQKLEKALKNIGKR